MPSYVFTSSHFPHKPGCYLMKDKRDRVIYVGKAKSLRNRLSSYFQPGLKDRKAKKMVTHIQSIEVILVNNEYESLVLENNLIKLYRPRFNRVLMGDTSGYFYIQMTGEIYPRFLRFRKNRYVKAVQGLHEITAGTRFGPYTKSVHREMILEFVNDYYGIRTCKPLGHKVCLRYHLHRCSGICEQKVTDADYATRIKKATEFLAKPQLKVMAEMHAVMLDYAEMQQYEQAQKVKMKLEALGEGLQKQVVETDTDCNQDVIYFGDDMVLVTELHRGTLLRMQLQQRNTLQSIEPKFAPVASPSRSMPATPTDFINNLYHESCPDEIITNLSDVCRLQKHLSARHAHPVMITCPKKGLKYDLLGLCEMNYRFRVQRAQDSITR